MDKTQIDRILKTQLTYWFVALVGSTGLALFAKFIWTHKFPILLLLPMVFLGCILGSINALKQELSKSVSDSPAKPTAS